MKSLSMHENLLLGKTCKYLPPENSEEYFMIIYAWLLPYSDYGRI